MPDAPRQFRPRNGGGPAYKPKERRGTDHQRGYGWDWAKVRALAWHDPDKVLCDWCAAKDLTVQRQALDHVIPITGRSDPLRLDLKDLRGLCHACHQLKTARQDQRIRREFDELSRSLGHERARDMVVARWRRKTE